MRQHIIQRNWTIPSDIGEIDGIVADAVNICVSAGVDGHACRLRIPVALTEALSNAICRGNLGDRSRRVHISLRLDSRALQVEVTDEGTGFDAAAVTFSPDDPNWLEREDGRGLFLMRNLMDKVELIGPPGAARGHTVRLTLNRP